MDFNTQLPHQHTFNIGCGNAQPGNQFLISGDFKLYYGCDDTEIERMLEIFFRVIRDEVNKRVHPDIKYAWINNAPDAARDFVITNK